MKYSKYIFYLLMLVGAAAFAGGGHDHSTGSQDNQASQAADDRPSVAITQWTDKMELFMEYPVLVANKAGKFIIHLTILNGFQPIREGEVKLTFTASDGHIHEVTKDEILREGIFTPMVELHEAGKFEFVLTYTGPGISDEFIIDGFTVYTSAEEIPHSEEVESGDEVGFLKEQQWKIPFATIEAETREIKKSIWAVGEVIPSPNAYVEIVSPVDGIVHVGESGTLALPGSIVQRNDIVATITPPITGNGWASTQLAFEQSKRDYERAQRLKEKQAISDREFERIRDEYLAMKAGFEAVSGGGDIGALALKAPISGKIIEWQVRPGQQVSAGDKLMAIVDPNSVWLRVNVYENNYRELGRPVGAFVKDGPNGSGWTISESEIKLLSSGGALDPATRTVPVLMEVANPDNRLRINASIPVELYVTEGAMATAIPKSAVYEEDGMDVVFVQTGGESFEKRIVALGSHYDGWMAIKKGINPGERVVATGGYHVKLASTTAEIGHGHAH
jgi:RND family efflux transporter MFP subunit